MPASLPVSLASTALLLLPLSVRCIPMQLAARQDEQSAITQTIMSTYFVTTTTTTFMTVSSASAETSTAVVSPVSDTVTGISSVATSTSFSIQAAQTSDSVSSAPPTTGTDAPLTTSPVDPTSASTDTSITSTTSADPNSTPTSTPTPTDSLSSPSPTSPSLDPSSTSTPSNSSDPAVFTPGGDPNKAKTPPPSTPPAQRLVMAYYPDWATADFPPEKIDFQRLDWIDFAFAVPDANFNLNWDGSEDAPAMLQRLVTVAHKSGKHVKLSVGGWSGSKYFSTACSTSANRQKLATNILTLYNQFQLDGIDIDWEYPGQAGNDGNVISSTDTANYLLFLQTLRKTLPNTAKITAATMTVPFADSQGNPMKDVSAFAKVLDWILIMNYDTWGSSSNPGPNAPLNDACGNSTQSSASALSAVKAWTNAGFPAPQIVLGVPSYGYISRSSAQTLHTRRSLSGSASPSPYPSHNQHNLYSVHTPRNPHPRRVRNRTHKRTHHHARRSSHNHSIGRRRLLEYTELAPPSTIPTFSLPTAEAETDLETETLQAPAQEHLIDPSEIDHSDQNAQNDTQTADASDASSAVSNAQQNSAVPPGTTLVRNEDGGFDNGQVQFRDLLKQGVLLYIPDYDGAEYASANMNASALTFAGKRIENWHTGYSGFARQWDGCSNTPYLRGGSAKQVVSYDDPQSLEMKGMFAKEAGLLGVNMFDVHGDTDHWDLTDAIRRGLGLN